MQPIEEDVLGLLVRALSHDIAAPFRTISGAAAILSGGHDENEILPLIIHASDEGAALLGVLVGALQFLIEPKDVVAVPVSRQLQSCALGGAVLVETCLSDDLALQLPCGVFDRICRLLADAIQVWGIGGVGRITAAPSETGRAMVLGADFRTQSIRPRALERFFVPVKQNYFDCSEGHVPLAFLIKVAAVKCGGDAAIHLSDEGRARLTISIPI